MFERAAERDPEMCEVAAHAGSAGKDVARRGQRRGGHVVERDRIVDPLRDCVDTAPAAEKMTELLERERGELVRLAVAAREEVDEHVVGQLIRLQLRRVFVPSSTIRSECADAAERQLETRPAGSVSLRQRLPKASA